MGLDMYLDKAKRVGNVTPKDINALNEYFSWLGRGDDYKNCSMKRWCGIDRSEVPTELIAVYEPEYVKRYFADDPEHKYGFTSIWQNVGYWRKANHIHNWFVENVQGGEDDCRSHEVTKEQLQDLLEACRVVKNANQAIAKKLLPTAEGFFFGDTDYDEWYFKDIETTIAIIKKVLAETDFDHEIVAYVSSW